MKQKALSGIASKLALDAHSHKWKFAAGGFARQRHNMARKVFKPLMNEGMER